MKDNRHLYSKQIPRYWVCRSCYIRAACHPSEAGYLHWIPTWLCQHLSSGFHTFGHCLQVYKRFCQRSWIKMKREWHHTGLVGIWEWLIRRKRQLRSRGRWWSVRITWRNRIGKNEIAVKKKKGGAKGFGWDECTVVRDLVYGSGALSSGPCSATGRPSLPVLSLCVLACQMHASDQTRGLKTLFWLVYHYSRTLTQHPDIQRIPCHLTSS